MESKAFVGQQIAANMNDYFQSIVEPRHKKTCFRVCSQTARMHRLICAFVVSIWKKQVFS